MLLLIMFLRQKELLSFLLTKNFERDKLNRQPVKGV